MKKPSFTLRGFKQPREAVKRVLGKLERTVLELLWQREEISVREAYASLAGNTAYTTLLTTFDRLHRKGLLKRRKESRAFVYQARVSREEFVQTVARDVIDELLGRDAEPMLACIVDAVSARDKKLLDELTRLIQQKRHSAKQKGEQ